MIRASGLPSAAGDPRIGGSNRRRGGIKNSGKTAMQRSASIPTRATSSSDDAGREEKKKKTVIGLGSCGLDYLALVAAFPKPDDKLRTEKLEMQGGGNCANALTAAARLGRVRPYLVSRVGNDGAAEAIAAELERDGVSTRFLSRWRQQKDSERQKGGGKEGAEMVPSPSTYIIVDREGGTRTCIHTPGPAFGAADLEEMMTTAASDDKTAAAGPLNSSSSPTSLSSALDSASLVFFDGRLAEAALPLADAARARGVPVLVEAERPREGLGELLERATFVTTSASFPALALSGAAGTLTKQESSSGGDDEGGDASCSHPGAAAAWLLASLPESVSWVSTTLGARGAVLLERRAEDDDVDENAAAAEEEDAASAVDAALAAAEEARSRRSRSAEEEGGGSFAARSSTGAEVGAPGVVSVEKRLRLPKRAAGGKELISVRLYASTAAALPGAVVDSTGAGDAFNGALIHALASSSLPPRGEQQSDSDLKSGQQLDSESSCFLERALALACVVAGCNCLGLGARGGLPRSAESVSGELLL